MLGYVEALTACIRKVEVAEKAFGNEKSTFYDLGFKNAIAEIYGLDFKQVLDDWSALYLMRKG